MEVFKIYKTSALDYNWSCLPSAVCSCSKNVQCESVPVCPRSLCEQWQAVWSTRWLWWWFRWSKLW